MNKDIDEALIVLQNGRTILYPTDTIWGLGCDATNESAIQKIFRIKKREESKSLIILLPEAKDVFKYTAAPHPDIIDIIKNFEKPTTVIYNQAIGLPDNLISQDGSIAIRIVKDAFCKMLLKRLDCPLVSTSANISGYPTPVTFADISDEIKNAVDYIVPYRRDENLPAIASRIVSINEDGSLKILRD